MKSLTALATLVGLIALTIGLHADTHRYVPSVFYGTFSSTHPPALRIKSGDVVTTATLDDEGGGADGKSVAQGSNPLTGPFYVEGAEPGDLLVVTIVKLEPNRSAGASTSLVAAGAIASGGLAGKPDQKRFLWTIDKSAGVVRLDLQRALPNTDWRTRFTSPVFELPLRPTLGSIGVAPAGDESPATTSGPFGGNMVSTAIAAGAKVMLPVQQPGALLYLGHGLARQGDGDITGSGVETSLDIEFSVALVKKKAWPHSSVVRPSTVIGEFAQDWPRIETDEYVVTVGSATSLNGALQHATLELHHWLDDDFGLSEKTVSLFLGQAIEYEIANVAGPSFTVVAKVRKAYLPKAR
ncbi:MAG TPA: acetamidase/formamidase family protein [Vicinamibacterales bacterium]|jgi:acetamidase/formamidase